MMVVAIIIVLVRYFDISPVSVLLIKVVIFLIVVLAPWPPNSINHPWSPVRRVPSMLWALAQKITSGCANFTKNHFFVKKWPMFQEKTSRLMENPIIKIMPRRVTNRGDVFPSLGMIIGALLNRVIELTQPTSKAPNISRPNGI